MSNFRLGTSPNMGSNNKHCPMPFMPTEAYGSGTLDPPAPQRFYDPMVNQHQWMNQIPTAPPTDDHFPWGSHPIPGLAPISNDVSPTRSRSTSRNIGLLMLSQEELECMRKKALIQRCLFLQNKLQKKDKELENRIPQMKKRKLRRRNNQMDAEVHDDTESLRSIDEDLMKSVEDCSGPRTPLPTPMSFDKAVKRYREVHYQNKILKKIWKTLVALNNLALLKRHLPINLDAYLFRPSATKRFTDAHKSDCGRYPFDPLSQPTPSCLSLQ
ncbi:unnamed protein product [Caenorhabditis nigoni]